MTWCGGPKCEGEVRTSSGTVENESGNIDVVAVVHCKVVIPELSCITVESRSKVTWCRWVFWNVIVVGL